MTFSPGWSDGDSEKGISQIEGLAVGGGSSSAPVTTSSLQNARC